MYRYNLKEEKMNSQTQIRKNDGDDDNDSMCTILKIKIAHDNHAFVQHATPRRVTSPSSSAALLSSPHHMNNNVTHSPLKHDTSSLAFRAKDSSSHTENDIIKSTVKNLANKFGTDKTCCHNNNTYIGIDIGHVNMALTVVRNEQVIDCYHYTLKSNDKTYKKNLNYIIFNMLDEVVFGKFDQQTTYINIEEQIGMNRMALVLQNIVHTMLYMKNYHVKCVNAKRKYTLLKSILGISKRPRKTDLSKYFNLDISKIVCRVYNCKTRLFEVSQQPLRKYDDIIDSYLVAVCE